MAKTKIVINRAGIVELLKSEGVAADLNRRAGAVAAAAGEGHETDSAVGTRRARASVRTVTGKAVRAEAKDRNLTRAFDAGRR